MNNISNLLLYDINNIKCQYRITNATINAKQKFPTHNAQLKEGELFIDTNQVQIRQDSTNFYASIGLRNSGDLMRDAAQKGKQAALEAIANYAKMGKQMAQIDKGVTIAQVYRQKFLQQSKTTLEVKRTECVDISFEAGTVKTQYMPSSLRIKWDVDRAVRKYTPPHCGLDITQTPSIDFIYQGTPQYVPESAIASLSALA